MYCNAIKLVLEVFRVQLFLTVLKWSEFIIHGYSKEVGSATPQGAQVTDLERVEVLMVP